MTDSIWWDIWIFVVVNVTVFILGIIASEVCRISHMLEARKAGGK